MPGISAAEKYAELEARGEERPKCECHGETMYWALRRDVQRGGQWNCAVKQAEATHRWYETHREAHAKASVAWAKNNPEKMREIHRRHGAKRRSSPSYRRKKTIYQMELYYRRKHERWADQGLTLGNDGEKGSACGDHAAA